MTRWNHAYTLAFELVSGKEDGLDVTGAQLRKACVERLLRLSDEEMTEACDAPYDTYVIIDESDMREQARSEALKKFADLFSHGLSNAEAIKHFEGLTKDNLVGLIRDLMTKEEQDEDDEELVRCCGTCKHHGTGRWKEPCADCNDTGKPWQHWAPER